MSDSRYSYVGADAGSGLTLLALWAGLPGEKPAALERSWPARARVEVFRATTHIALEDVQQVIRELCRQGGRRPEDCLLVRMGEMRVERALELAGGLGMRGVIEPLQRFVLWSEGVLPAQAVREYSRPVPTAETVDLDQIRSCFAELMERAAQDMQALELDQDDSLLDHLLDVRYRGRIDVLTIPVESLTDAARLLRPFHAIQASRLGRVEADAPVEILTARLRCIVTTTRLPPSAPIGNTELTPPAGWTRQVVGCGQVLWNTSGPGGIA